MLSDFHAGPYFLGTMTIDYSWHPFHWLRLASHPPRSRDQDINYTMQYIQQKQKKKKQQKHMTTKIFNPLTSMLARGKGVYGIAWMLNDKLTDPDGAFSRFLMSSDFEFSDVIVVRSDYPSPMFPACREILLGRMPTAHHSLIAPKPLQELTLPKFLRFKRNDGRRPCSRELKNWQRN